jgi:predicted RNase H-like HicB family nuclease
MDSFFVPGHFVKFYLYLNMKFTAIIEQDEGGWFVGQIEEVPAAISQGKTVEALKANLTDALKTILDMKDEPYICI